MIYLDHNATTRPSPEVIAAMTQAMQACWANPSSKHAAGQASRSLLGKARESVAALLGARPQEIVFTSGATEGNIQVLRGALARPGAPRRIALSAIEHAAFLKAADELAGEGVEIIRLPVDELGRVRTDTLDTVLTMPLALVSVMLANNETGVIQPIAEISRLARQAGIPVHVDATQGVGKLPIDFSSIGIDLMTLSAHKLYGPQGVGALVIRKDLAWPVLLPGQQERGRRGGTENLPGIAGFGVAARQAIQTMLSDEIHVAGLHLKLETALHERVPGLAIHGAGARRLSNTTSLRIAGLHSDRTLMELERQGICAASGAACSSSGNAPSHVLLAMGLSPQQAQETIRLSLGRDNTAADIDSVINALETLGGRDSSRLLSFPASAFQSETNREVSQP